MNINIIHGDHGVSKELIIEALSTVPKNKNRGRITVDFNKTIGFTNLVSVNENDTFYEKVRGERPYKSRFVVGKSPEPATKLTVVYRKTKYGFQVITAYFTNFNVEESTNCPDEPGNILRKYNKNPRRISLKQIEDSLDFWSRHAFVEGN